MAIQLTQLIEQLQKEDLTDVQQEMLQQLLKAVYKKDQINEFKIRRTIRDKDIVVNMLNQTIEELKVKQKDLEESKKKVVEESEFKEQLFANVSHELRTPLNGILGMSHLLDETQLDTEQKEFVNVIKSSADNLLVIVNDFLNLSKLNAGKVILNDTPFNSRTFFEELKGILEMKASEKNLELEFFISSSLPEFLVGDQTRIYQILINLLNNSIKFTHTGYVHLMVKVLDKQKERCKIQFQVKDTGIGMSEEKIARIFDSFSQVHENKGKVYEGTGLGLSIVKSLVKLMDGKLTVESEEGEGSCFTLSCDLPIPNQQLIEEYKQNQEVEVVPLNWLHKKFLVLEDNKVNLFYIKNMFSNWNIDIDTAITIKEARHKLSLNHYDCLLSDVKLPDGNGIEFIIELRQDQLAKNKNIPIIVLTAGANEKDASIARKYKVYSYVSKPFPPDLLIKELNKIFFTKDFATKNSITTTSEKKEETTIDNYTRYFSNIHQLYKGDSRRMLEMIDAFIEQVDNALIQMSTALKEKDWDTLHFHAHTTKSSLKIVGLNNLMPQLQHILDKTAEKKQLDTVSGYYTIFQSQIKVDLSNIKEERQKLQAAIQQV